MGMCGIHEQTNTTFFAWLLCCTLCIVSFGINLEDSIDFIKQSARKLMRTSTRFLFFFQMRFQILKRQISQCKVLQQKLYVGNLTWTTNEDTLQQLFGAHGQVNDAFIIRDKLTGNSF